MRYKTLAEINNIEISNRSTGDVSKNLSYHTSHTGFMHRRNIINNDNRRQFVIQDQYFTYQRKGNHELAIQALNIIVTDLQNHINYLSSTGNDGGGGGDDSGIGTMWFDKKENVIYLYIYTNMWN